MRNGRLDLGHGESPDPHPFETPREAAPVRPRSVRPSAVVSPAQIWVGRLIPAGALNEDRAMFGFKKRDPAAKLRREYEGLMAQAVELQRRGDIKGFAEKTREAADIEQQMADLEGPKPAEPS